MWIESDDGSTTGTGYVVMGVHQIVVDVRDLTTSTITFTGCNDALNGTLVTVTLKGDAVVNPATGYYAAIDFPTDGSKYSAM